MFGIMSGQVSGALKIALKYPKLSLPFIKGKLTKMSQVEAMLKTTCVATMLNAGTQPNVLPQNATAILNMRVLPGDDIDEIVSGIAKTASKLDINCDIEIMYASAAPRETSTDSAVYSELSRLTKEIHGALPMPYIVTGATDSREYAEVADEIYRFYPFDINTEELASMHSTNERIKSSSLFDAVVFLKKFIINVQDEGEEK